MAYVGGGKGRRSLKRYGTSKKYEKKKGFHVNSETKMGKKYLYLPRFRDRTWRNSRFEKFENPKNWFSTLQSALSPLPLIYSK